MPDRVSPWKRQSQSRWFKTAHLLFTTFPIPRVSILFLCVLLCHWGNSQNPASQQDKNNNNSGDLNFSPEGEVVSPSLLSSSNVLGSEFLPKRAQQQATPTKLPTFHIASQQQHQQASRQQINPNFNAPQNAFFDPKEHAESNIYTSQTQASPNLKSPPEPSADLFTSARVLLGNNLIDLFGTYARDTLINGYGTFATTRAADGGVLDPSDGQSVLFVDMFHVIRRLDHADGTVATVAGRKYHSGLHDATGTFALFKNPSDLALISTIPSSSSSTSTSSTSYTKPTEPAQQQQVLLFVADAGNNAIRRVALPDYAVTTVAGSLEGLSGFVDGPGLTHASFYGPKALAVSRTGHVLYVCDTNNNLIRLVDLSDPLSPHVTTIAGQNPSLSPNKNYRASFNGVGTFATFFRPMGIAVDPHGNVIVADTGNHMIRLLTLSRLGGLESSQVTVTVTTLAGVSSKGFTDSLGSMARFNYPRGVSVDIRGDVYVADTGNNAVRLIARKSSGDIVSTVYRHQSQSQSQSPHVGGIDAAAGSSSSVTGVLPVLQVAEAGGGLSDADTKLVTLEGRYIRSLVRIDGSSASSVSAANSNINANSIENKIDSDSKFIVNTAQSSSSSSPSSLSGEVLPWVGGGLGTHFANGIGSAAGLFVPRGIAVNPADGSVAFVDIYHVVRQVTSSSDSSTASVQSIAGAKYSSGHKDALGTYAKFRNPFGLAFDSQGRVLVADAGNHVIRRIDIEAIQGEVQDTEGYRVTTLAGTAGVAGRMDGRSNLATFRGPRAIVVVRNNMKRRMSEASSTSSSDVVYVADTENGLLRRISLTSANSTEAEAKAYYTVAAFAGGFGGTSGHADGVGSYASFSTAIYGLAWSPHDNSLVVVDSANCLIRRVSLGTGRVTTLAGRVRVAGHVDASVGSQALFKYPTGVTVGTNGVIYVADTGNNVIRAILQKGAVYSIAGNSAVSPAVFHAGIGTFATFDAPEALAVGSDNRVYVFDRSRISVLTLQL